MKQKSFIEKRQGKKKQPCTKCEYYLSLGCVTINDFSSTYNLCYWKNWCWSWNFNTLATWCEGLAHWKRPWCWERLRAGGEGDDRGWDGWMAWVWVDSGSWWWTGRPGMLRFMGLQRVRHDWATELNWTDILCFVIVSVMVVIYIWPQNFFSF